LAFLYRKLGRLSSSNYRKSRIIVVPLIYAAVMCGAYLIMPPNPDEVSAPMDLVQEFRIASVFTMSVFWGLLGLILGAMWDRVKPHETAEVTMH
jgi:predicted cobalt transporter CbtA